MPLFIDAYEAATTHLSLEEDGAYNRLLRLCWRQHDCSIPDDAAWITRKMRCDDEAYGRVIKPILDEFFTGANGKLFQKRQRREHSYVKDVILKRKAAGRKGGLAKSLKEKENSDSKTTFLPEQNPSKAVAPTLTLTLTPKVSSETRDAFDVFDAALRKIEGVENHPVYTNPVIAPLWQLVQQGYDLKTQITPSIKRQLQNINGKRITTWAYFVPGIIEDSNPQVATQAVPQVPESKWASRMDWARKNKQWYPKWGPVPPQPGCAVPAKLLNADDGKGWTEFKPAT